MVANLLMLLSTFNTEESESRFVLMLPNIISVISILIAIISLFLSVKIYRRDTPRLVIDIKSPEYDCFFGNAQVNYASSKDTQRISGVYFEMRNPTPESIEVRDISLQIKNEDFRLIPKDNSFWQSVSFLVKTPDGEIVPDYNRSIEYEEYGISFPTVVEKYKSLEYYALFYSFPAKIHKKTRATLIVKTAIGIKKKRIVLREYDYSFALQELKEVEQYYRSKEERK